MGKLDHKSESNFAQPVSQIIWMLVVLGFVGFGTYLILPTVEPVILANPQLNGFILLVFVIGVFSCFWQVFQLVVSVSWFERFLTRRAGDNIPKAPRLLAPLAALLGSRVAQMKIGSSSARSILDSVATRIDEARDITRYIVSLLIFLGLLGTFYGLATTIPGLVETIKGLAPKDGEGGVEVLERLIDGLQTQLGGMGTAFASSLLGLAGSLVVGLLELFASHGQNQFYRELEEWLSTITRLGFSSGDSEGGDTSGVGEVLDNMAAQMEAMQVIFTKADASRSVVDDKLGNLTDSIERMTAKIELDAQAPLVLNRVADAQEELITLLSAQAEAENGAHVDAESRMRLRSIDVQLLRILEEISAGRQESTAELRADLSALTQALRALTPDDDTTGGRGA